MKKILSIILSLILMLALLPITAYALPRTFDKSRVHRLDNYRAALTIDDMTFEGQFSNAELTDAKLDELVKKTLVEMGLDEVDFDLLNDLVNTMKAHDGITTEQMQKIFDRWFDMMGAVPGVGQAASLVQIIIQLNGGDYSGPAQSAAEEAGSQLAEGLGDAMDASGKLGKAAGSAIGIGKALKAVIEGMMDSNIAEKAIDRALGLEAYQLLTDFYGKLNRETDKHYKENAANFMVKFDKAAAEKPYEFFGTQNSEKWTLDMTLFQTESYNRMDIDGQYEGQYTLTLEYDLSGFQGDLNSIVQGPEWKSAYIATAWEASWGAFHISVTNPGLFKVKRTLSGDATAILYTRGAKPSINPNQHSDVKDIKVSDINIQASAEVPGESSLALDCSVSAHDDVFKIEPTKWLVTWPQVAPYNAPDSLLAQISSEIAWDTSIWQRANKAHSGWKITLSPPQGK